MSDCIFCKIAKKEIPTQFVYENDLVMVIKDIEPVAPTHLLVIPKNHVANICDQELFSQDLLPEIFKAIQEVAEKLDLKTNGFRVVANYGKDAGESMPHLHFHIIAGRPLGWPPCSY